MTKYDRVERLLELYPEARESFIECYALYGLYYNLINEDDYVALKRMLKAIGQPESIRRARQLVQNKYRTELGPSKRVAKIQNELADRARESKGMSVANDERWTPPIK